MRTPRTYLLWPANFCCARGEDDNVAMLANKKRENGAVIPPECSGGFRPSFSVADCAPPPPAPTAPPPPTCPPHADKRHLLLSFSACPLPVLRLCKSVTNVIQHISHVSTQSLRCPMPSRPPLSNVPLLTPSARFIHSSTRRSPVRPSRLGLAQPAPCI